MAIKLFRNKQNAVKNEKSPVSDANFKQFLTLLKQFAKNSTLAQIEPYQLYRYLWSIQDWRNAMDDAENILTPDKLPLIEIFKSAVDDYSVFSGMQQRTSKVINCKLMFLNEDGSENEQIKPFFINADGTQKPWFRRWLKIAEDVKYYGFEVAQLGIFVNDTFKSVGLTKSVDRIPEENLIPSFRLIKIDASGGTGESNTISMDFSNYSPWLIPMGNEKDLGLINKCIPYVIWKYIFGNWRQHAEIFGMPFREGRTDIYDAKRIENMQSMFENMVSSTYAILHPDDEIQFLETTKTDAYNIYDKLIERCDFAITKIMLSQTGTTDEKAFVGSAEVHENVLNEVVISDRLDISEYFGEILIPKLKALNYIPQEINVCLTWIVEERISLKDWADIISKLAVYYDIPDDEIQKRFDLKVEKKQAPDQGIEFEENKEAANKLTDIMAKTQRYYKKLWQER